MKFAMQIKEKTLSIHKIDRSSMFTIRTLKREPIRDIIVPAKEQQEIKLIGWYTIRNNKSHIKCPSRRQKLKCIT